MKHDKPVALPMDFAEALARIAQTPKASVDKVDARRAEAKKNRASRSPPRSGRAKAT